MAAARLWLLVSALVIGSNVLIWHFSTTSFTRAPSRLGSASQSEGLSGASSFSQARRQSELAGSTAVKAHNLLLRKGPDFRVYVRWLRGQMVRTRRDVNPSFDDPDSFILNVTSGIIRANVGDIGHFLNSNASPRSPLKNISLSGDGNRIKLHGTLHKLVSVPIELIGTISALPENRIQVHVTKLNVLTMPLKGVLGAIHVTVSDLFHTAIPGIEVAGDDIFLDTQRLLPPPHVGGELTSVRIVNPDFEAVYGNPQNAVTEVEEWRNFLQLRGGTLDFGKLTMHHVDLMMIDISDDAWFDLDLAHYQEQLVNGYTRMTPQAGLQIFMPDLDELPHTKANQGIDMQWLKNRNLAPPPDIAAK